MDERRTRRNIDEKLNVADASDRRDLVTRVCGSPLPDKTGEEFGDIAATELAGPFHSLDRGQS